jgi:hypothetical protein
VNREPWRAHGTAHTTTPWRRHVTRGASASINASVAPEVQRTPAPPAVAEVKPRTSPPADPAAIALPPPRPSGHHDRFLIADLHVLDNRPTKPNRRAHTLVPRTSHPLPSVPVLKKPEP